MTVATTGETKQAIQLLGPKIKNSGLVYHSFQDVCHQNQGLSATNVCVLPLKLISTSAKTNSSETEVDKITKFETSSHSLH